MWGHDIGVAIGFVSGVAISVDIGVPIGVAIGISAWTSALLSALTAALISALLSALISALLSALISALIRAHQNTSNGLMWDKERRDRVLMCLMSDGLVYIKDTSKNIKHIKPERGRVLFDVGLMCV